MAESSRRAWRSVLLAAPLTVPPCLALQPSWSFHYAARSCDEFGDCTVKKTLNSAYAATREYVTPT